jgi:capsular exopolysaccharide synthesis family protein
MNLRARLPWVIGVAMVATCGLIVAIYLMRDTVKTPSAARRRIDARMLRTIGHERKNKTFRSKLLRKNAAPLIVNRLIKKSFIEDNMSFASTLEYHMRRHKQQVVLMTSVGENEGKSTVASNLALALARKQHRVVLLDCDFRKPSVHKIFEVDTDGAPLLTQWILGDAEKVQDCLLPDKKHGVVLGISKATGKGLVRLLNNGRLAQLLQSLRREADYVILDTPPMMAAADVESIAALADTAVLVVRADFMPVSAVNEGLDRLRKSAPEVCGFVLNNHRTTIL